MSSYIDNNFMLESDTARELYLNHAAKLPIIDYHCHLDPAQIAANKNLKNITWAWLGGDHYKWRAMRANGIDESFITGDKDDYAKFEKWAETMPYLMRNPLYHWTHLELKQIFGIDKILNPKNAKEIYDRCNELLSDESFKPQNLISKCNVELLCTTDDPTHSLEYHKQLKEEEYKVKVLPTWRPDMATAIDTPNFNDYINNLEKAANISISSYSDLIAALKSRHDYFDSLGCKLSDHGLDTFYAEDYTPEQISSIFDKARSGKSIDKSQGDIFRSAMLFDLAVMDYEKGWTQQFHIGPIRNNSPRMFKKLGADCGFDAINDMQCANAGHKFFGRLDSENALAKSILYNLNSYHNDTLAAMAFTFNDGSIAGKMQFGSAWWFLDNEMGMVNQLNTLSSQGLLSRFVGMLTDSRSLLSYPRHDYFRRILCNIIGSDVESGKLPKSEMEFISKIVEGVSYRNAKDYFKF